MLNATMKEQGWEAKDGVYSFEHCNGEVSEICEDVLDYIVELPLEDAEDTRHEELTDAIAVVEAHEAWIRLVA